MFFPRILASPLVDLPRSSKIKQDQTRSTKGPPSLNLQELLAETNHENAKPQTWGGRRCHAAWRLQSAPGPWAPETCLTENLHSLIYYISIILVFFLGYILSGGFFDVKLGVRGVTPPPPFSHQFASIFSITLVPFTYVIPTSARKYFFQLFLKS